MITIAITNPQISSAIPEAKLPLYRPSFYPGYAAK